MFNSMYVYVIFFTKVSLYLTTRPDVSTGTIQFARLRYYFFPCSCLYLKVMFNVKFPKLGFAL